MIKQAERIRVTKETDLAHLLDTLTDAPVLLERKGRVYRLVEESRANNQSGEQHEDMWAGYDRDKARTAWMNAAGSLRGIDVEEFIADLHAQREQESSGRHD